MEMYNFIQRSDPAASMDSGVSRGECKIPPSPPGHFTYSILPKKKLMRCWFNSFKGEGNKIKLSYSNCLILPEQNTVGAPHHDDTPWRRKKDSTG